MSLGHQWALDRCLGPRRGTSKHPGIQTGTRTPKLATCGQSQGRVKSGQKETSRRCGGSYKDELGWTEKKQVQGDGALCKWPLVCFSEGPLKIISRFGEALGGGDRRHREDEEDAARTRRTTRTVRRVLLSTRGMGSWESPWPARQEVSAVQESRVPAEMAPPHVFRSLSICS